MGPWSIDGWVGDVAEHSGVDFKSSNEGVNSFHYFLN